jgi:succinate-acetate transporter protein
MVSRVSRQTSVAILSSGQTWWRSCRPAARWLAEKKKKNQSPALTPTPTLFFPSYGILTTIFFVGTLSINRALQVLFASLAALFFLLAIGLSFPIVTKIAGWWGLFVAAVAFYTGSAELWAETHGRPVLPLGAMKKKEPAGLTASNVSTGAAAA